MQAFASQNLQPGDTIASETDVFEITGLLGQGGMGIVYLANQLAMKRVVALKMVRTEGEDGAQFVQRLRKEAKGTALLDHPNIVKVFSFNVSEKQQPFLVMEYIEGKTLRELIDHGAVDQASFFSIFSQVLDALNAAHQAGLIHRDIKPSNIMVTAQGKPKLMDFGVAKHTLSGTTTQALTQAGGCIGSPLYMSPEQCKGESVDGRSDLYSLGCVMFEVLSGKPPFEGETPLDVMFHQLNESAPRLQNVPKQLAAVIDRALQKDSRARFASAAEMLEEFEKCQDLHFCLGAHTARRRLTDNQRLKKLALIGTSMVAGLGLIALVANQAFHQEKPRATTASSAAQGQRERPEAGSPGALRQRAMDMNVEGAGLAQHSLTDGLKMQQQALELAKQALSLSQQLHSSADIADSNSLLGRMLLTHSPRTAETYLQEAIKQYRLAGLQHTDNYLDALETLGSCQNFLQDFEGSLQTLQESYKGAIAADRGNGSLRSYSVARDIARTYYAMGNWKEADAAYCEALKQIHGIGLVVDPPLIGIVQGERADVLLKEGKADEWLTMLQQTIKLWQSIQPPSQQSVSAVSAIYLKIADGSEKLGKFSQAREACAKGKQYLLQAGGNAEEIFYNDEINAEVEWAAGNRKKAIAAVEQLELQVENKQMLDSMLARTLLVRLASWSAQDGDANKSRFWEQKLVATIDKDDPKTRFDVSTSLGDVYLGINDTPSCMRLYKAAYHLVDTLGPQLSPTERAGIYLRLSNAYLRDKQPQAAAPLIKQAGQICEQETVGPAIKEILVATRKEYKRISGQEI